MNSHILVRGPSWLFDIVNRRHATGHLPGTPATAVFPLDMGSIACFEPSAGRTGQRLTDDLARGAAEARNLRTSPLPQPGGGRDTTVEPISRPPRLRAIPCASTPLDMGFSNRAAGGKLFLIVCQDQGSLRSRRGAAAAWRRSGQATRGLSRRADRPSPHVSGSPAPHRPGRDDRMEAYRERVVLLLSWRRSSGSRCHRSTCDAG
jgi:hypothetical protein